MSRRELSPYERWMVKSNLETIRQGALAADVLTTLRANGYPNIADAVVAAVEQRLAEATDILNRLHQWESSVGGWDSPVWRDLEKFLGLEEPHEPC